MNGGGYGTSTGITDPSIGSIGAGLTNTNSLISMNLQPETNGWNVLWDKVKEFRKSHSDKWFVPSEAELRAVFGKRGSLSGLTTIYSNQNPYYWCSSEYNSDREDLAAEYATVMLFDFGSVEHHNKYTHGCRCRLCRQI